MKEERKGGRKKRKRAYIVLDVDVLKEDLDLDLPRNRRTVAKVLSAKYVAVILAVLPLSNRR